MSVRRPALVARMSVAAALACTIALVDARDASALAVFAGDPVDPATALAYPMIPGLPLLLPGNDGVFGTGDDVVDTSKTGDVDLVVRVGAIGGATIPPPAGTPGGASVVTAVAGGGTSGQGGATPFTVMLSDGSTATPEGNAITNTEIDGRPVAVYAFADLDGDGRIGPTGAAGDAFRLEETTAYVGRQVGVFSHGALSASIGVGVAAPASIGGLDVELVAAAYTGQNSSILFSDGTLVLTHWPFFPPLDPTMVLDLVAPHPPDPQFASQLDFDIAHHWLPAPNDPVLGTPFALAVGGSDATVDHFVAVSGPAVAAGLFTTADISTFRARSSARLRVAPVAAGNGRALVEVPARIVLPDTSTARELRVLPVDRLGNVADPGSSFDVTVTVRGELAIASPDADSNPATESLSLADARGAAISVIATGIDGGRVEIAHAGSIVASLPVLVGQSHDSDGDTVPDDGDASGVAGDDPCDAAAAGCDDNCPNVVNPSQLDSDHDGAGDCCDGACIAHPTLAGCNECASAAGSGVGSIRSARISIGIGTGTDPDTMKVRASFSLPDAASGTPDALRVSLAITEAGHGGYLGDITGIARDPSHRSPLYQYADPNGAAGGVTSARFLQRTTTDFRATLRASATGMLDLAAGPATLSLYVSGEGTFDEDDLLSVPMTCVPGGRGLRCRSN